MSRNLHQSKLFLKLDFGKCSRSKEKFIKWKMKIDIDYTLSNCFNILHIVVIHIIIIIGVFGTVKLMFQK